MSKEGPLVSVAWLAENSERRRVVPLDVRYYLSGKRGVDEYEAGHIPGAHFIDLDVDLAGSSDGPGRHPLPSVDTFLGALMRNGLSPRTIAVAYDDVGGAMAARFWWLSRYFGFAGARVLDGGLQAWVASGRPLETGGSPCDTAPPCALSPGGARVVDKYEVARLASLDRSSAVVLDARARERYEGISEPIDARPGHIPGALSAPFVGNLVAPGGTFLPPDKLAERYRALGALDAKDVVVYCGSGVTACHDLLALAILGRDDAALYEGSWSDWARDPSLPAVKGPEPR